jgi:small basic protein
MWLPILGLIGGILVGQLVTVQIPIDYVKYTAIAILAAMDAVFGGIRAQLDNKFDLKWFVTSFFANTALAGLLAYMGDLLGVDIYLGAVVAFSIRLFTNLSFIRGELLDKLSNWKKKTPSNWHHGQIPTKD